jgi:hypothetical protein
MILLYSYMVLYVLVLISSIVAIVTWNIMGIKICMMWLVATVVWDKIWTGFVAYRQSKLKVGGCSNGESKEGCSCKKSK